MELLTKEKIKRLAHVSTETIKKDIADTEAEIIKIVDGLYERTEFLSRLKQVLAFRGETCT